ncbi:TPA: acetyl-CoA C-acetyltransferase [Legionella pneumophila]|uniref:Beta-ketoacyl-CoA thiolase, anaerobic, subunit n=1 Tax=Legionella pneumophila subsp. pneumophila TaxID=91891 RepID=A0AAV2UWT6_LEGPN|nr:acetyl-CoA C-acetyltransferase [Legionella pneumophila]MCK1847973.1 acetyl-CoA C-acetyltransferase [Legionella pneumophila]MCZ4805306.1 acetyl-CoA C-acetyltransferase [Legionella pneumophila]MDI9851504.1 acetyl-CoA C-acetyltransferase [Legionella pneumophila]MDW8853908.1 acetyl-CoA C-acetyltransferase [Legionella pneumophila]MDW8865600.1 acetyl-CoA C-acetyltransferase [Legionella pneumophila]
MKHQSNLSGRNVYVVDGSRTPFLKAKGVGPFCGSDLAVAAGTTLLNRQPFSPDELDEVIIGSAMPGPDEANIARVVALRLGCGDKVPAFTVMRNCASGMQALDNAAIQIATGRSNLVLAGGTDAMSHAPLLFNEKMASWLANWFAAKSMGQKLALITKFKPSYLAPVIALLRGLTDPIVGLNMGQTAEKVAYRFNITREQMDEFAAQSHLRIAQAYAENRMSEVAPIIDYKGCIYPQDDGIRADSTVEKLSKLKPFFDKKYGMVTPGNSSQITDGACLLLLASAEAVKKYALPVLGRIVDSQWAALDPSQMGLGPVHAATPILERHNLKPQDLDCWEINEAFAAQVLGCLAAWNDEEYCKTQLGLKEAMGSPSLERLNRDGGAIALGHPIGASGARIVLHVLKSLEQRNESRGMAAICIGGGQGGAMYLERVTEVKGHE